MKKILFLSAMTAMVLTLVCSCGRAKELSDAEVSALDDPDRMTTQKGNRAEAGSLLVETGVALRSHRGRDLQEKKFNRKKSTE